MLHFRTALHWASRRGHRTVIELLLKYGADPTMTDTQGRSAADVAADQSIVMLLGGKQICSSEQLETIPFRTYRMTVTKHKDS